MTQATIELKDDVYARLKERAELQQLTVEQYIASVLNRVGVERASASGAFSEFIDSVADIHFETSGPWTRDELYER